MSQVSQSQINCLKCKQAIDAELDQCPHCGERVTVFQRTYASRLLDSKYQILDRLGVGGMGEIFKVRHIHLNELRVIKIMRPNVASDDQGLQRFLQEARTSTMIKHKNLAMLYDFAQLEDGSYYMVWEFIDGTNIQKWIATNGPIPSRLAIEISIQALMGLDHLHSMGLIHRDISPENIMLSQDHHGKLLVKVIDFGIAKQLAEGEGGQGLTQTGMFLGKLKYASPEQAGFLKEGEHLDPRSDLYSFGIVMYEMLAGRAPFQATNPHGYILKHVTERPAAIADLNPEVSIPPQLESLIFRSLEKSRDQRYPTAAEFASALEGIRNSVAPDKKYGLGEKMITLSGAQTLADLPKVSTGQFTGGTVAGRTAPSQGRVGPTGTRAERDEATMMEAGLKTPTLAEVTPTVMERKGTLGGDEATVMERIGGAGGSAPTQVEAKMKFGSGGAAEATVMERQLRPGEVAPKKKNTAMMGGIAAAAVLVIAIGAYFVINPPGSKTGTGTGTSATNATQITQTGPGTSTTITAPPLTGGPIPAGKGVLLLSATPWGELEKIVDSDRRPIDLEDDEKVTPTRIVLNPGAYTVTLKGPNGSSERFDVTIEKGQSKAIHKPMSTMNMDDLTKEFRKP